MFLRSALIALTATALVATSTSAGQDCKVTVCHVPGGDASKVHAISVGVDALDAHLAHGDTIEHWHPRHVPRCEPTGR